MTLAFPGPARGWPPKKARVRMRRVRAMVEADEQQDLLAAGAEALGDEARRHDLALREELSAMGVY
jgi:hypothetical protein